jgi:hypothetical protein
LFVDNLLTSTATVMNTYLNSSDIAIDRTQVPLPGCDKKRIRNYGIPKRKMGKNTGKRMKRDIKVDKTRKEDFKGSQNGESFFGIWIYLRCKARDVAKASTLGGIVFFDQLFLYNFYQVLKIFFTKMLSTGGEEFFRAKIRKA